MIKAEMLANVTVESGDLEGDSSRHAPAAANILSEFSSLHCLTRVCNLSLSDCLVLLSTATSFAFDALIKYKPVGVLCKWDFLSTDMVEIKN